MAKKAKVFKELEKLSGLVSSVFYWTDTNAIVVGINRQCLIIGGTYLTQDSVGRSIYEIYPIKIATTIANNIKQVIQTGKTFSFDELITDPTTGKVICYTAIRSPLFEEDQVVGTLGIIVDITTKKEAENLRIEDARKKRIFEELERIADIIPYPLYWTDTNIVILGANETILNAVGDFRHVIIGKSPREFYKPEEAEAIIRNCQEVIATKKVLYHDESIKDITTGKTKYFTGVRGPVFDELGNVIGILGTSIDITAEKEAESLRVETERQKMEIAKQEQFKKIFDQVAHDIRSPLASLLIVVKSAKDISEDSRIALREAITNISDIANNLLTRYEKDESKSIEAEEQQPVMIALVLSQVLSDKKHQYKETDIKFTNDFDPKCTFTFIKVQSSIFKRMMSNLLNNAVEALEGKKGIIHLDLSADENNVKIIVQDSGKGMPQEIIDKILNNVHVATDKKEGHGIGLTQIQETLASNQGNLSIDSKIGEGTKMILTFPIIVAPNWIGKDIRINQGDTIVILDDDMSIHGAWDARFSNRLTEVDVKHFMIGNEAVDFINNFPEKEKIFLLTDFELLKQDLDGINILEKTSVSRAILVTSHHADLEVRNRATRIGVKILPKQLASEVPIEICGADKICATTAKSKKVDIVIIDDDHSLINSMETFFKSYNKTVDKYYDPRKFLEKTSQYDKDTKIFMDNGFGANNINGIDLAKRLHEKGLTKLYLFSGTQFKEGEVPDYLTVILKSDIDTLCKAIE